MKPNKKSSSLLPSFVSIPSSGDPPLVQCPEAGCISDGSDRAPHPPVTHLHHVALPERGYHGVVHVLSESRVVRRHGPADVLARRDHVVRLGAVALVSVVVV